MLKVLFFYSDGEASSKIQEEFVKNIEIIYKGKIEIIRINARQNSEQVKRYKVSEIPTIIIEKNGLVRDKFNGLSQEIFLKRAIERNLS